MHPSAVRSDRQLLRCFTESRDREALGELFGRHYPAVFQVVRRMVHDEFEARDVTQAVFLTAMDSAEACREPERFRHWLLKIAVNEVRQLKRRKRPELQPDELFEMFAELQAESAEQSATRVEFERALEVNLDKMPPKLREPLVLHYYQELSLAEISSILSCPKSTVQNRLDKAIRLLRTRFNQQGSARLAALLPQFLPAISAPGGKALLGAGGVASGGVTSSGFSLAIGGWFMSHFKFVAGACVVSASLFSAYWGLTPSGTAAGQDPSLAGELVAAGAQAGSDGTAETARPEEREDVTAAAPVRARVVDGASGAPITHFWVLDLPAGKAERRFGLPRFNHCGTWFEMRDAVSAQPGAREVRHEQGEFEFVHRKRSGALVILAAEHAMLVAIGEPFGGELPVFRLSQPGGCTLRILDHLDETPVVGASLHATEDRSFDFVSRLRSSFGSSALALPTPGQTGLRSDADGLIRLPLLVTLAVYAGRTTPTAREWFVPGAFTVRHDGYAYGVVAPASLAPATERRVFLDPAAASVKVSVSDGSGTPVPAGLIFDSQERESSPTGCFTDERGECVVRGLPAGRMKITVVIPRQLPAAVEAGRLLREQIVRKTTNAGSETRTIQLRAGAVTEFVHRVGSAPAGATTKPKAYLFGRIDGLAEGTRLRLQIRNGDTNSSREIRGEDYQVALDPGVPSRVEARWQLDGVSVHDVFQVPPLRRDEKHRLDLRPPATDRLVRLQGKVNLANPDVWLPDGLFLQLLEGRRDVPATPEVDLFAIADRKVRAGAAFSVRLAPGRYKLVGQYPTDPTRELWNWFELMHIDVHRDAEVDVHLPPVSRVRVQPVRSDGKTLRMPRGQAMWCLRPLQREGTWRSGVLWSPGSFEILFMAKGYRPYRGRVEVGRGAATELRVPLAPGAGGVISGVVVDATTLRPLASKLEISCSLAGVNDDMQIDADMGRFEITGLAAGDYVLKVGPWDAGIVAEEVHFHLEPGEVQRDVRMVVRR